MGSLSEALKSDKRSRMRVQLVSYTIIEKCYALRNAESKYLSYVESNMNNG
ncbi:MAG: hypothetical protein IJT21_05920 [Synergistaceae bacterium]|nr:hypothetical protein [Synergistaceae bacterium]